MLASNCTVMVIIPFVALVGLNWQIHKALKKREEFKASLARSIPTTANKDHEEDRHKKERDLTVTQILVAIVIMFFICQSFKVRVIEKQREKKRWRRHWRVD